MPTATKIVATLGPNSLTDDVLPEVLARADVARLNCSHGTAESLLSAFRLVREHSARLGRHVAVLVDLQGPKIRLGQIDAQDLTLGQVVEIEAGRETCPDALPVVYPGLAKDCSEGDRILLCDGQVELRVLSTSGARLRAEVVRPGRISSRKGVNLPGVPVSAANPTEHDLSLLIPLLAEEPEYVALSFVRSRRDIDALRAVLEEHGSSARIVAKLERPEILDDLEGILDATDVVMVARGDLGVELGPEKVPVVQKRIIAAANARAIPVITATEMLESMITSTRPTRAEASDVANAVFDGTDAVMLSAETAAGAHPTLVLSTMRSILSAAEDAPDLIPRERIRAHEDSVSAAVALGVARAAQSLNARAVVVHTQTGDTARVVSAARPGVPIVALSPSLAALRRCALHHGVIPHLVGEITEPAEQVRIARELVLQARLGQAGDRIVIATGTPGTAGATNRMLVETL